MKNWDTRDGWTTPRRVMPEACPQHDAKAEWTEDSSNPHFLGTSLHWTDGDARKLYEDAYCARGEMENRIKECQTDLFAGRTSAASMRANQLRLWLAGMAYIVMAALRRIGLAGSESARATYGSVRLKLLKIGALITISVRRVKIAFASSCPYQAVFAIAHHRLRRAVA